MGVTRTESHEEDAREPGAMSGADPARPPFEAPTAPMLVDAVGERCVNCGAPLASDQRYCVQCGERRGKSRFVLADATAAPPPPPARTVSTTSGSGRRRPGYGATLVAGIATLLLAMGVGVEIGRINHENGNANAKAPAPTVITVGGGGTAAATTSSTAAAATPAGKSRHTGKAAAKKATKAAAAPKPTKAAVQKASHAASSVLGSGGGQSNATVTTGQSCAQGSAGCSNGHFDGSFFGQ